MVGVGEWGVGEGQVVAGRGKVGEGIGDLTEGQLGNWVGSSYFRDAKSFRGEGSFPGGSDM